ncbi:nitroreductase/quinone reductase family protein [Kribbella sp. NPDC051587]|uniref:nitroreductase/quinone reductase family protein n=1 Tax=Kribbella sp. NPDC051587 TaxID=3364119 RepID=UPI0037A573F3
MPNPYTDALITEFRANDGRLSGPFAGGRMLLLTTTGRRTGRPHTAIIAYYPDRDRVLVVGSAGGSDKHPDWYLNLLTTPEVTVETGLFTYQADAVPLEGTERDEVFDRLVEANAGWGEYQAGTTRAIPVIALTQKQIGPPRGGGSFADLLIRIHTAFRRELALIREEVATSGTAGVGAQLRVNCLTLCQGLHHHHTGESAGVFPALLQQHPELADEITALITEHDQLAVHLEELEKLLQTPQPNLLPEVDRIVALLTAHLDHEEAALLAFL